MYKEYTFQNLSTAKKKAKKMKEDFGYKPEIFRIINPRTRKKKYIVVKPKGLKKCK